MVGNFREVIELLALVAELAWSMIFYNFALCLEWSMAGISSGRFVFNLAPGIVTIGSADSDSVVGSAS